MNFSRYFNGRRWRIHEAQLGSEWHTGRHRRWGMEGFKDFLKFTFRESGEGEQEREKNIDVREKH